ncbi:PREDICTED: uncharacterized protein LOC18601821 [Theobroma cacao]|uniref:Uncharacterized protein LOC18601821 n=1 Tax=Theobroma cacao TaxID=3641 RepID=A0AB32V6K7_THECC|nr:PREDICTED: uncharacterized protein LOC18601821 [Theobroma cacao]
MSTPTAPHPTPPIFDEKNYTIWAIKMEAYLRGNYLWNAIEYEDEPPALRDNETITQIKQYSEEIAKRYRVVSFIRAIVSEIIFSRIMGCKTAKEAWNKLQQEFQGSARSRQMQVQNLRREFELLRMKDTQFVMDYADRVMSLVNQIRMLGEDLQEVWVVEKILNSVPEKFKATVSSLEQTKDLSQLTIIELVTALEAYE